MRTFSRHMPGSSATTLSRRASVALGLVSCVAALTLAYAYLVLRLVFPVLILLGVMHTAYENRRQRRMQRLREGESICTFARAFDRRSVDPWVIRAVYEQLQPYCTFRGGVLALRATDRFKEDLHMDPDEATYLLPELAERTRRSLRGLDSNPYLADSYAVEGLVLLLNSQPRAAAA